MTGADRSGGAVLELRCREPKRLDLRVSRTSWSSCAVGWRAWDLDSAMLVDDAPSTTGIEGNGSGH